MADTTTITVRLHKELRDRLDALAESTKRSKSFLAAEAIAQYVELNAWQVEQIKEAVEKADAGGPFIPHEEVEDYFDRLARGEKPERPQGVRR